MNIRTKTCPTCGKHFSYEIGRGKDRKHCSAECRQRHQIMNRPALLEARPSCTVEGCEGKAARVASGMCETHYYRVRRTGSTDRREPSYRYVTRGGYVKLLDKEHPLSDGGGAVFEHRRVMFELHRGICQPCFWCGAALTWKDAVIDHLNEKKADNRPENLVTACNGCNRIRGAMQPFLRGMRQEAMPTFMRIWDGMKKT